MTPASIKRCAIGESRDATSHACPVDGARCEVLDAIAPALPPAMEPAMLAPAIEGLPCDRCRRAERAVAGLAGLRLGRVERSVLGYVASGGERGAVASTTSDQSPAWKESVRRAIRKLRRAGLVVTWDDGVFSGAPRRRRMANLSPVGEAVRACLGAALDGDKPIRWALHLDAIRAAARFPTAALVERFAVETVMAGRREGFSVSFASTDEARRRAEEIRAALSAVVAAAAGVIAMPAGERRRVILAALGYSPDALDDPAEGAAA